MKAPSGSITRGSLHLPESRTLIGAIWHGHSQLAQWVIWVLDCWVIGLFVYHNRHLNASLCCHLGDSKH